MKTYSKTPAPSVLKAGNSTYLLLGNSKAETPDSPHVQKSNDLLLAQKTLKAKTQNRDLRIGCQRSLRLQKLETGLEAIFLNLVSSTNYVGISNGVLEPKPWKKIPRPQVQQFPAVPFPGIFHFDTDLTFEWCCRRCFTHDSITSIMRP